MDGSITLFFFIFIDYNFFNSLLKMKKLFLTILTITTLLPFPLIAQKWKRQRVEYSFGLGASNFLGDLGGRNQIGTNGLMDFEYKATRYAVNLGYRYQFGRDWYVKGNLFTP